MTTLNPDEFASSPAHCQTCKDRAKYAAEMHDKYKDTPVILDRGRPHPGWKTK